MKRNWIAALFAAATLAGCDAGSGDTAGSGSEAFKSRYSPLPCCAIVT